jgi:HD superfamily phosphodiesterase
MDNKIEKYKKLYNFIVEEYKKTEYFYFGVFDETFYSLRVYETAKIIINELKKEDKNIKINEEEVLIASILHDIGKTKLDNSKLFNKNGFLEGHDLEWEKHPIESAKIVKSVLEKENYDEKFIKDIQYLVGNHSLRKGEIENKSIELKILQDSDIISDIGAAGFIRFFSYAGRFKKNIIETIKNLQNNNKNFSDEILNLDISKKIAEKEMKIQKNLTYGLLKEIDSDLL